MKHSESLDRNRIPHHRFNEPIPSVFPFAQSVAVLDSRSPSGDVAGPLSDLIIRADVFAENLAAPAVVIAGDPEDGKPRIVKLRERGKGAKASPRNHCFPFEPEVEQVAVDDERRSASLEAPQEGNE